MSKYVQGPDTRSGSSPPLRYALSILVAVAISLFVASCVWDVNGDGQIVIACLGDSNTYPYSGHCEKLRAKYPNIVWINYGVPGSKAVGGTDDGLSRIAVAAAGDATRPPADVVLLAYGTNDIGPQGSITASEMADRIDMLVAAAATEGVRAFVATIPPRFTKDTCNPAPPSP